MSEPDQDLGMYGEFTERRARGEDTKQALRIKIAESLGWKKDYPAYDDYDRESVSWRNPMGRGPLDETYIPNYDTDANAALQLVEVLAKDCWEVEIRGSRGDWQCTFYQTAPPNWGEWIDSHAKSAPTLPEAICLAYCAVKSIQTDK